MDNELFLGRALKYDQKMSELRKCPDCHLICFQTMISLDLAPTYCDSSHLGGL